MEYRFIKCFNPANKYGYLGYTYIPFKKGTAPYIIIYEFLKWLDNKVKPWWIPYWFMNLLHLYGNDNSIVRVRNWTLHDLHRRILKENFITDLKTKWGTMRIYGHFNEEVYDEIDRVCDLVEPYIEIY